MTWAVVGTMPTSPECEERGEGCRSILELIGPMLAVQAIDAIFFSWDQPADTRRASAPAVLPGLTLREGGGTLSLSGRF
jgi:hypothetical protein